MDVQNSARPPLPLPEKLNEDTKSAQSSVKCMYQVPIAGLWRNVSVLWGKNLMNQTFTIDIDNIQGDLVCTCKVDLKPWHFWSKKGTKYCDVEGSRVEVYWDLRSAKFSGSPEPSSDYYVALVSDEEVVLLLGDNKRKAYKKSKAKPALSDAIIFYKKENVLAKKSFLTRAKLDERRKENEIVVESSTSGTKDPEMWISVDGIVLIHVRNLQWKFRGNQSVMVHKQPVQVFWDVHDWLFGNPGTGHGLFIFKPGATEADSDKDSCVSSSSGDSVYHSTLSYSSAPEFCLFLHAYKLE